jgi:hypothetical protein
MKSYFFLKIYKYMMHRSVLLYFVLTVTVVEWKRFYEWTFYKGMYVKIANGVFANCMSLARTIFCSFLNAADKEVL